jgi:hypothetical protein
MTGLAFQLLRRCHIRIDLGSVMHVRRKHSGASGIASDAMKPIADPIVGGMITSTIHVLILVPVFFVLMKERTSRRGTLRPEPTPSR